MNRALALASALLLALSFAACGDGPDAPQVLPTATPTRTPAVAARTSPSPAASATAAFCGPTPGVTPGPQQQTITLQSPVTTQTGLRYQDVTVGTGATPERSQTVCVHYTGRLASNGQKFDSSLDRGAPSSFALTGVVPGFSEGILSMKVGGKRILYIPSNLAYGAQGRPPTIPANADLIFEVELIGIR